MPDLEIAALPTKIILNGYRIDSVHVRGGFGITYLGTEVKTGEKVVIKENIPGKAAYRPKGEVAFRWTDKARESGPGSRRWAEENFLKEVRSLASLKHPNIVPVKDGFRMAEMGTAYMVMPYISPTSLSQLLEDGKKAESKHWVGYLLASLLDALQYLHGRHMMHRDIKPSNILIAEDGRPILIDFGAARPEESDHLTRIHTVNYSSIEQQQGKGEGPWSDIYSLGATMYHLITGEKVPGTLDRSRDKDCYIPLARRNELLAVYGHSLLSSIDKALELEAADRFRSAAQWSAALVDEPVFQKGVSVPIPPHLAGHSRKPVPPAAAFSSDHRGRKALLIILLLLLLALGAAGAYILLSGDNEGNHVTIPRKPDSTEPTPTKTPTVHEWPQRVLARPAAKFYDSETCTQARSDIKPAKFGVYYVRKEQAPPAEEADFYRVSQVPDGPVIGALRRQDVYPWPHNLLVQYKHGRSSAEEERNSATNTRAAANVDISLRRDPALYFSSPEAVHRYVTEMTEHGRKNLLADIRRARTARSNGDPTAAEHLAALLRTNGVVAMEPDAWNEAVNEHMLPVLGYATEENGQAVASEAKGIFTYRSELEGKKNPTGILRVAAMRMTDETPQPKPRPKPQPHRQQQLRKCDIVFVIDTTKSMGPYMRACKQGISNFIREWEKMAADRGNAFESRYGFITFRDLMYNGAREGVISSKGFSADENRPYPAVSFTESKGVTHLVDARTCEQWVNELKEAEVSEDPDFHEDLPAALELLCSEKGFPWRTTEVGGKEVRSMRLVLVITDAAYREPGQKEEEKQLGFKNGNPARWDDRMVGSAATMSMDTINQKLHDDSVYTYSILINTNPHVYGSQIKGGEKAWSDFVDKAEKQMREFSILCRRKDAGELSGDLVLSDIAQDRLNAADYIASIGTELAAATADPDKVLDIPEDELTDMQRVFRAAYVDWLADQTPTQEDAISLHGLEDPEALHNDMVGWTVDTPDTRVSTIRPMMVLTQEQFAVFTETLRKIREMLTKSKKTDAAPTKEIVTLLNSQLRDPNVAAATPAEPAETDEELIRAQVRSLPYLSTALKNYLNGQVNNIVLAERIDTVLKNLETCKEEADKRPADAQDLRGNLIFIPIKMLP